MCMYWCGVGSDSPWHCGLNVQVITAVPQFDDHDIEDDGQDSAAEFFR